MTTEFDAIEEFLKERDWSVNGWFGSPGSTNGKWANAYHPHFKLAWEYRVVVTVYDTNVLFAETWGPGDPVFEAHLGDPKCFDMFKKWLDGIIDE